MPHDAGLLRSRLLKWLAVALALLFVADTTASYWMAQSLAGRAYDRALVELARDVSLHLRRVDGEVRLDLPQAALAVLFNDPFDRVFHEVTALDGRRISGAGVPSSPEPPVSAGEVFYDAVINAQPVRVVQLTVASERETGRPAAIVRIAETKSRRSGLAREMLLSMIVPQLLLIAMAAAVVWIGVVLGLRPLDAVRQSVLSRAPDDLGRVPLDGVPGELRPLLVAINGLLERLDRVVTMQRRFVADAAHQLKTPVAALLAQIEVAGRETDSARMQDQLESINAGLGRLARLMSQLLSLARNEPEGAHAIVLIPLDLTALVLEAASAWVPEALKRRIDLGFEAGESVVTVRADAVRLRELLDNLLDNAVRYSVEGGRITVRVEALPRPAVHIADDGPTIAPDDRDRIFERFHRVLGSPGDGSGLGLAIAQEIARAHGATIRLAPDEDGVGNVFSLVF